MIGVSDDTWGEVVLAYVQPRPGRLSMEQTMPSASIYSCELPPIRPALSARAYVS